MKTSLLLTAATAGVLASAALLVGQSASSDVRVPGACYVALEQHRFDALAGGTQVPASTVEHPAATDARPDAALPVDARPAAAAAVPTPSKV